MKLINIILISSIIVLVLIMFSIIPRWQYISLQNAFEHEYEKNIYDCDDFSKALVEKLTTAGYEAEMIISEDAIKGRCGGYKRMFEKIMKRDMFCHAWVVIKEENRIIPIEATNGFEIPLNIHNTYAYGTLDGNNEWLYKQN